MQHSNDLANNNPSERDTSSGTVPFNSSQNTERYFHQITEPESAPGFITNVLISNNTTDNEDDGYEILSSRDEAAERGALFSSNKMRDRKNLRSEGHFHKKGRKVEGTSDVERLTKDSGQPK